MARRSSSAAPLASRILRRTLDISRNEIYKPPGQISCMRVLVLGGYGVMGSVVARDLVKSGVSTIVAGRDVDKARKFCEQLDKLAFPARIDVNDKNLVNEIKRVEADVVVNCTWYEYNMIVMPAVIEAGVHYVDLGGLYHKTLEQLKLNDKAREKGVTCILGCGSTAGPSKLPST